MADPGTYQFHVLLREVNTPIWRRLLIRSGRTIADLYFIIQIAFRWTNVPLHRFLIRGQEYGIGRAGCGGFTTDARKVRLADFHFRRNARKRVRKIAIFFLLHSGGGSYCLFVGGIRRCLPEQLP